MRIHFFGGQLQKTIRLPIIIAKSKLIKQQIINGCQMLWKVMTSIINGFQRRIIKNQLHYSLLETFQAEQLWLILINFKIKQNIILFSSVLKCLLTIFCQYTYIYCNCQLGRMLIVIYTHYNYKTTKITNGASQSNSKKNTAQYTIINHCLAK